MTDTSVRTILHVCGCAAFGEAPPSFLVKGPSLNTRGFWPAKAFLLSSFHAGEALIVAPWPGVGLPVCSTSISHWGALQGIVYAIRNARAEYNVEVGRVLFTWLSHEGLHVFGMCFLLSSHSGNGSCHCCL